MDIPKEYDMDMTMETKSHYKLRSSLKKSKSRNPLGSLDMTEVTADITLAPPPRRVSFAASNYVKPFMDDPEKNTIWDNTYEEEVNHTDSTKSENTNHTNLSELKSNLQENTSPPQSDESVSPDKETLSKIYCDQSMIDMEFSCFDETLTNEQLRNNSSESNSINASHIAPILNTDEKNCTDMSMEFTCQWKNNIIQSSKALQMEVATNKEYLINNSTIYQEGEMSMTCCKIYENAQHKENVFLPTDNAECSKIVFLPSQPESDMEFTCAFPPKILEMSKQPKDFKNVCPNKENVLPSNFSENSETVYNKKDKFFLPPQTESEMEFTCAFPNKILETSKRSKEIKNNSSCENKENLLPTDFAGCSETVLSKKVKFFPPSQHESAMEFTCAFPNKILEMSKRPEETKSNSLCENKENIVPVDLAAYSESVCSKKEIFFLPPQPESEMEFTCAFPNKILEIPKPPKEIENNSLCANKENIVPADRAGCPQSICSKKEKFFLPPQPESEMEFTCAFPSKISEISTHSKDTRDKPFLPNQPTDEMEFTCQFQNKIIEIANQPKKLQNNSLCQNKKNVTVCNQKEKAFLLHQPEDTMEFTCAFQNKILERAEQPKVSQSSPNCEIKESILLHFNPAECSEKVYDKKEKAFLVHQSQSETKFTAFNQNHTLKDANRSQRTDPVKITSKDSSDMEFTCQLGTKQYYVIDELKKIDKINKSSGHSNIVCSTSIKDKLNDDQDIKTNDIFTANRRSSNETKNTFKCNTPSNERSLHAPCQNSMVEVNGNQNNSTKSLEYEQTELVSIKTEISKRVKVREFGNIPVAVDVTDLSIDQNFGDVNPVFDISRRNYDPKKNMDVIQIQSVEQSIHLKQKSIVVQGINDDLRRNHNAQTKNDLSSLKGSIHDFRESMVDNNFYANDQHMDVESVDSVLVSRDGNIDQEINQKQNLLTGGNTSECYTRTIPVFAQTTSKKQKATFERNSQECFIKPQETSKSWPLVIPTDIPQENIRAQFTENSLVNKLSEKICVDRTSQPLCIEDYKATASKTSNLMDHGQESFIKPQQTSESWPLVMPTHIPQENIYAQFTENSLVNKLSDKICGDRTSQPLCIEDYKAPPSKISNLMDHQINNSLVKSKTESLIDEECTLIDSIPSLDEEDLKSTVDIQNEVQVNEDERFRGIKQDLNDVKNRETKVIYSEPMKHVKPSTNIHDFSDKFPSSMNPFNFSSIGCIENTEELLQATFSKKSFQKNDQLPDDKSQSGFLEKTDIRQNIEEGKLVGNETNACANDGVENETLKADSILKNIHTKLFRCKFELINYQEIAKSITEHEELINNMEKLLLNFRFPEIGTFNLNEKTRKLSLPCTSSDGNSSSSLLELMSESGEDNNYNKSILVEPTQSLHQKILDVCTRSHQTLKLEYGKGTSYIFTTANGNLYIYVRIHPEDGRVTEIKLESALKESSEMLIHFLIKQITDKLKQTTLKSCLGPYYDILSLLDHICLTVDEVMDFKYEFWCLQKLYPTLQICTDSRISLEILYVSPPIWWTMNLEMASVTKIQPDTLRLNSKWEENPINEEHIKQIIRNIDEGIDCLKSFVCNVTKYFEKTQLRRLVQHAH